MADESVMRSLLKIKELVELLITRIGESKLSGIKHGSMKGNRSESISFESNVLAFMKKHGRRLSGDRKFTLLLAHSTRGDLACNESFSKLKQRWNKMKGVMGGPFNPVHANRAKANGWVDTPKHGKYCLTEEWKVALGNAK